MQPSTAREWISSVLDPVWELLFEDIVSADPLSFPGYAEQLREARAATGSSESALVAAGTILNREVIVISFEFGFLGGSMGVGTGERICRAFERAAEDRVPVIALIASGGARMQEGMAALAQMPATVGARNMYSGARQPFIAYLRNPTTGGVFASFASSADIVWAQPGATIGFAGPRIAEAVTGAPLPEGSHIAEFGVRAGLIDDLIEPDELREAIVGLFGLLDLQATSAAPMPSSVARPERTAWQTVELARRSDRPTGADYVAERFDLRAPEDAPLVTGIMPIDDRPVVCIAHARRIGTGRIAPSSFRAARNAIGVAWRLGLPIVTFIDTPGAEPGAEAERGGIAAEISSLFTAMLGAQVPTVACIVGEGGSGGGLAFATCDRLLAQDGSMFSVIAPEFAASILKRSDVEEVAGALRLTAYDLRDLGLADLVVDAPIEDLEAARAALESAIAWALDDIVTEGVVPTERRRARWRSVRIRA
jgi:acyl-CoA carboxylase subunit beta